MLIMALKAVDKTIPVHYHNIEQCLDDEVDSINLSPVNMIKDSKREEEEEDQCQNL